MDGPTCKECGVDLPYPSSGGGRQRIFCSRSCGDKYRRRVHPAEPEPHAELLPIAVTARAVTTSMKRVVAELNRRAASVADVLCADDEPWSTDEPMPDLRHLWDTRDAMLHGRPGKSYGGRYRAWTEVQ